jgi:hypothetical protein
MKEYIANQECYLLCHNGVDVFHCVHLFPENKTVTGQPIQETFPTKDELIVRLQELITDKEKLDEVLARL